MAMSEDRTTIYDINFVVFFYIIYLAKKVKLNEYKHIVKPFQKQTQFKN